MLKFKSSEDQLFWSSDIHAYHKNITRGVSRWDRATLDESTRDFNTPVEMTEHIIKQINDTVPWDAHLFLLGDLLFHNKSPEDYYNLLDGFLCDNIYILFGNHDSYQNLNELQHYKVKYLNHYMEIQVDKIQLCMSHYPIDEWNDRHMKSYMLHGHTHGKLNDKQIPNRLDVGIDSYFKMNKEYKPFSWGEICKLLK